MRPKKFKTIGELFNSLLPNLLSVGFDKETLKPFSVIVVPKKWKIDFFNLNYEMLDDTGVAFIVKVEADDSFDTLIENIQLLIDFNKDIEEKERKFKEKMALEQEKLIKKINPPIHDKKTDEDHAPNNIVNWDEPEESTETITNKYGSTDISFLNDFRDDDEF